ncbi:hypothetical protein D3C71_1739530 [compost metagenome]
MSAVTASANASGSPFLNALTNSTVVWSSGLKPVLIVSSQASTVGPEGCVGGVGVAIGAATKAGPLLLPPQPASTAARAMAAPICQAIRLGRRTSDRGD